MPGSLLVYVGLASDALIQVLIGLGVDVGWNGTYVMGSSKWGGIEPLGWLGGRREG